jgi:hypothetical protein
VAKKLLAKIAGEHRYVALASFPVTEEEALASYSKPNAFTPKLTNAELLDIQIGCIDCEEVFAVAHRSKCQAPAAAMFADQTEAQS